MNFIKNKYAKILFVLICLFFVNEKVNAARVCRYEITDNNIPYYTLTVGFSEGKEDAVNPYRQENGEYVAEYVLWYQFDNGPKHALKKSDMNSTNAQLWNLDTNKVEYRNFINANNWIARGCNIQNIEILYDSTVTKFGFSLSATNSQKNFDNLQNTTKVKITTKLPNDQNNQELEFSTLQGTINCAGAEIPYGLPYAVKTIISLLKIFTPIILVVLGMIDFFRATIASDEKQMKEASSRFIRRIIAAVAVFFVVAIVQFVFRTIGAEEESTLGCFNCFINGDCAAPEEK